MHSSQGQNDIINQHPSRVVYLYLMHAAGLVVRRLLP